MKRILLAACAILATPANAQSRPFDFMTLNTASIYSGEQVLMGKKCNLKSSGVEICYGPLMTKVGNADVIGLSSLFNNGHFFVLRGTTIAADYPMLKAAFEAKYGPATSSSIQKWQNQMGATFDNEVTSWKFGDGALTLQQMGEKQDTPEFGFLADNNRPAEVAPPVNF